MQFFIYLQKISKFYTIAWVFSFQGRILTGYIDFRTPTWPNASFLSFLYIHLFFSLKLAYHVVTSWRVVVSYAIQSSKVPVHSQ